MTRLFAAIETGGTKLLCRVVDDSGASRGDGRWPTTSPQTAATVFAEHIRAALAPGETLAGIGIAAFGPLVVNPSASDYGRMLETPKPGWTGSNLRRDLAERLGVAAAVDTDVNAAAIAEQTAGAGKGLDSVAYVTVGTGIGGGLALHGRSLSGALHPEVGHLRLIRRADDTAPSACPFHHDCAEGLTAGPAVRARLGEGRELADAPEVSAVVADYLGQLLAALVLAWTPQRILLGGGVMQAPGLIDAVRPAMVASLGGYGVGPAVLADDFLAPAMLENAGLEGALLMARAVAA